MIHVPTEFVSARAEQKLSIEVLPVAVNLYCKDSSELIACVENADGCAATLTIMTAVNPDSWGEMAQAIMQALEKMYPKQ